MVDLIGNETFSPKERRTQVYQATHDGAGNSLPYMNRSFISFTFGGKAIEDFGLIVVNSSGKMDRSFYAPFTDITTVQDTINGQLYWGTNLGANTLELDLATDEMTERLLDDFREWFEPGRNEELILSEHPNRAIMARVSAAPTYSFLPFEKATTIKLNNLDYETSTTVYRGEVHLSFVMDDPFWYGKLNFLPSYVNKETLEILQADDENRVTCLEDKDMIKIALEDGLPYQESLKKEMFLGNNYMIVSEARVAQTGLPEKNAIINWHAIVGKSRIGKATGTSFGFPINDNSPAYLFYSGTAKSYPTIEFTMPIIFNNNKYINNPLNKMTSPGIIEYSYIQVGESKFEFTTSGILTAYNNAIKIFDNIQISSTKKLEVLDSLKSNLNEYYIRAWAIKCLNTVQSDLNGTFNSDQVSDLKTYMKKFFQSNPTVTFKIDSKTGKAEGIFSINNSSSVTEETTEETYQLITQNVGDMVRSDYLVIEGRNYLNSSGGIDEENCKEITSNENLTNFFISYKNMYY